MKLEKQATPLPKNSFYGVARASRLSASWLKKGIIIFAAVLSVAIAQANNQMWLSEAAPSTTSLSFSPVEDAYLQGGVRVNDTELRIEANNRVSYLKFDVSELPETVESATLSMEVSGDPGSGTIHFYAGSHSNWTETDLTSGSAPVKGELLGSITGSFNVEAQYSIDLADYLSAQGDGVYTIVAEMVTGGNDVSFSSKEGTSAPVLEITYVGSPPSRSIVDFTHEDLTHNIRDADVKFSDEYIWNFSDTIALFDGAQVGNDSNTVIFGGLKATWVDEIALSPPNFQLRASDGRLHLQVNAGTTKQTLKGVLVWNQSKFLNYTGQAVVFDSTSSMSAEIEKAVGRTTLRFVVNDGGTYYVSDLEGDGNLALNDPASELWATIDLDTYNIDPGSYARRAFSNIQGVGIYIEQSASHQTIFQLRDFQVSAATPPTFTTLFEAKSLPGAQAGWTHYWNAPDDWEPGVTGDLSTGKITDRSSWMPLIWSGSRWTADGDDLGNNSPSDFLRVTARGGHPGGIGSSSDLDRYAISAFTVGQAGDYRLLLGKASTAAKGNGVWVKVFLKGEQYDQLLLPNDETGDFSYIFNELTPGDEIAVAVGANGDSSFDTFRLNYRIALLKPEYANPKIFNVADYGAAGNGVADDGPEIRAAIADWKDEKGPAVLYFEADKIYRLGSETGSKFYFSLKGVTQKVVEGNGAKLMFEPANRGFMIEDCDHIVVRDLIVDYSPLPYTQGTISSIDASNGTFITDPLPGDAPFVEGQGTFGAAFDPVTREYRDSTVLIDAVEELPGGTCEFTLNPIDSGGVSDLQLNDIFVFRNFPVVGGSDQWAVIVDNGTVAFENVTVHATPYFAFAIRGNTKPLLFRNITIGPPPIEPGEPVRLVSAFGDGFHFEGNRYGPVIEGGNFTRLLDDTINLKASGLRIEEIVSSNTIKLDVNKHQVGDVFQFVLDLQDVLGEATVVAINGEETELDALPPGANTSDTWVFNLARANAGYVVQNNYFGYKRRYAGVIRSGEGKVLNNECEDNDGWWIGNVLFNTERGGVHEGPMGCNILFQGNTLRNTNRGLRIRTDVASTVSPRPLQGIRIIDNHFEDLPNLSIRDAGNLLIQGNCFGIMSLSSINSTRIEDITIEHNTDGNGNFLQDEASLLPGGISLAEITFGDRFDYFDWADKTGLLGDAAVKTGDADADGMNNLLEYALGGDPLIDDAREVLPILQLTEDGAYFMHNQRVEDPSLDYSVEHTANFGSEVWSSAGVGAVGESTVRNNFKAVTHKVDIDAAGFFRLKIDE